MHVDRDSQTAKFWLAPGALANNLGFDGRELRVVRKIVDRNADKMLAAWREYFG